MNLNGPTSNLPEAAVRELIKREQTNRGRAGRLSGTVTLTFTASVTSNIVTVAHGLARTPSKVLFGDNDGIAWCHPQARNITATGFDVQGIDVTGTARTGANVIAWEAVV